MVEKIERSKSKKCQVTIFIILGLIIIILIIMLFLFMNPPEVKVLDEKNPQAYIETCTREAVEEALSILSPRGGDIIPNGSIIFNSTEITYLCYKGEYYQPCINQRPLLIEHIEKEITNYINPIVAECFYDIEKVLEKRYKVETSEMNLKTKLHSGSVIVEIKKDFKMSRKGEVRDFDEFVMHMVHPIYDLAKISMEIVNQEASYCNFDYLGYMIFYPRYDITKFKTGDSDIIYVVEDRNTNDKFRFAIRGCVLPSGF